MAVLSLGQGSIFKPLNYAAPAATYVGAPIEAVDALGEGLEKKYYSNLANVEKLKATIDQFVVRDVNNPIVDQAKEGLNKVFNKYAETGDYENATKDLITYANELSNNKLLTGALRDKAQYDTWRKELDDQLSKTEISKDTYDYYVTNGLQSNNKMLEYDKPTGLYGNMFNYGKPGKDQAKDIQQQVVELGKSFKASTVDMPYTIKDPKTGKTRQLAYLDSRSGAPPGYIDIATQEFISEAEVTSALTSMVENNPMYKSYIEDMAKVNSWKQLQAQGKQEPDLASLYSPDNPHSLFKKPEWEAFMKGLEESGKDPVAVLNDPLMIKALHILGNKNKIISGFTEPVASAVSYEKINHEYKEDIPFRSALELRNNLAAIEAKKRADIEVEKFKADYNKPADFLISNPGLAVQPNSNYSIEDVKTNVSKQKTQLAQMKESLADATSPESKAKLGEEIRSLEGRIAAQERGIQATINVELNSPENEALLKEAYDQFRRKKAIYWDRNNGDINQINSFNDFKAALQSKTFKNNPSEAISSNYAISFQGNRSTVQTYESLPMEKKTAYLENFMYETQAKIIKSANKAQRSAPTALSGETLMTPNRGEAKSGILVQAGDAMTRDLTANPTSYYVNYGGMSVPIEKWKESFKGIDRAKIEFVVTPALADHSINGVNLQANKVTAIDAVTKKPLGETWLYSNDGGGDEAWRLGVQMMREFAPGTVEHNKAVMLAANGKYGNVVASDLYRQSSYVTAKSKEPFVSDRFKIEGRDIEFVKLPVYVRDANGQEIRDTRYQARAVNPDGSIAYIANMTKMAQGFQAANPAEQTYFESIEDMKAELFKQLGQYYL